MAHVAALEAELERVWKGMEERAGGDHSKDLF